MKKIVYFNRLTQQQETEKVYGQFFLTALYGAGIGARLFSFFVLPLIARVSLFSYLYGLLQKSPRSRRKIRPFIKTFSIDSAEFLDPVDSYASFNDFFIRKLKPQCRPFVKEEQVAILPADARYLAFANMEQVGTFWVKGRPFSLAELLQDFSLAKHYGSGSMVIARLCPVDYHRFHFPCEGVPEKAQEIQGPLFSVNPMALRKRPKILCENKRMITSFKTRAFGRILLIEIGATYVGTICQTYSSGTQQVKGAEKGYFSFGGSCLILLFEPNTIRLDQDLLDYSSKKIEVRGLLGQSLGRSLLV